MAKNWYFTVNEYCMHLSECYNIPLIKVAGLLSALSPNNTFEGNCNSLEKFLQSYGMDKVSTFNGQKRKAKQILFMLDPTEDKIKAVLGGLKTQAFFENIYRPETSQAVTIDLWMIRIAKKVGLMPEHGTLTPKRYKTISAHIRAFASKRGLMPHQYQAIAWTEIRGAAY